MAPYQSSQPLGLDLAALATQGMAENDARLAGGRSLLDAYLNSVLENQEAGYAAGAERDTRMFDFQRQQALMADSLARRGQDQVGELQGERQRWEAEQAALQRAFLASQSQREQAFELGQAAAGEDDWMERERFQTDEAIRQAVTLMGLEEEASRPRLSDFGSQSVNPYRGQAILGELQRGGYNRSPLTREERRAAQEVIRRHGSDPAKTVQAMQELFGHAGRASIALFDLGYGM